MNRSSCDFLILFVSFKETSEENCQSPTTRPIAAQKHPRSYLMHNPRQFVPGPTILKLALSWAQAQPSPKVGPQKKHGEIGDLGDLGDR